MHRRYYFPMPDIKKIVQDSYTEIASQSKKPCCGGGCGCKSKQSISSQIGYTADQLAAVGAADMGLGCGNPTAFQRIKPGDTVVDLGCGGGIDCFLAAKQAGPTGRVIGIDFTQAMIAQAQVNAQKGGYTNVDFTLGDIEQLPLADNSVDVVISNCVINLAPDKQKVFREAWRVLKPGGILCVSDIVLLAELTLEQRNDEALIAGCVGGALLKDAYLELVRNAGFTVRILAENASISKQQYQGIPLESMLVEAMKTR